MPPRGFLFGTEACACPPTSRRRFLRVNKTKSENIVIENLFRNEKECEAPTIAIRAEAEVNGLTLKNIRSISAIDKTFEDLVLSGRVHNLSQ